MNHLRTRVSTASQIARVYFGRCPDAGAWYRREHRHLQRGQRGVVKATAVLRRRIGSLLLAAQI